MIMVEFEKVNDQVAQDFLHHVMHREAFGERWEKWNKFFSDKQKM